MTQNYGFLIDQSKCIGCHACSTACKSENQVPLGVNRTWVKYVETGAYPDVRRRFQVTRCNHCANPPCVRICPVTAMYQRDDGIVEFDPSICIGCKSCMQACPYDSIYLDPETNTAAKCHFCAHRLDVGLEPACVVVCPEHAILAGDLNDPASEISRRLSTAQATVRKPEQGTAPKLFYINGNDWSLHPSAAQTHNSFMWADKVTEQNVSAFALPVLQPSSSSSSALENADYAGGGRKRRSLTSHSGTPIRTPQPQGQPLNGPIQIGGRVAEHMVQTAYNAQHKIQWHWELPAYLVTKNIAGGLFMLLSLGAMLNLFRFDSATFLAAGFTAMLFMFITVILLIKDLSQPKRFLNILLRPQWKSWVARGAFILVGFTAIGGLWWLIEGAASMNWISKDLVFALRPVAAWITLPLALFSVIYTAFLLGQAEGRDIWQNNLLPFQLFSQSMMTASGVFLALNLFVNFPADLTALLTVLFPISIAINLLLTFAGKLNSFPTDTAMLASREMTHGKFRNHYWWGGIALGHVMPLVLMIFFASALPVAVLAALIGLFFYEYAFVMAPQYIPNS
ncbi:MAG: polysulfide reductase NrfD [Anaerolineae bacterium]|nr:polysulfide reductase NrfD [Anaerolineae bacterium]MBL8104657.1 polysulfide reductase NrfD [Anaerolineales bacterium]MCC7189400.1 polysulfide reductase NrfD [Anaerolineales bacterium]